MLKDYQKLVVADIEKFFTELDSAKDKFAASADFRSAFGGYAEMALATRYNQFQDRPKTGAGRSYPRACIKMPTGGGKTLVAVEAIRSYQNLFAKRKTGLVVWIAHREQIYRQTIENLQNKSHVYRQLLDQASGNRTLIVEKGQALRRQDVEENLVVLMLMIQSTHSDANKIFEDSGYTDFFPQENRYDLQEQVLSIIPNLDTTSVNLFGKRQVKTSLGNVIRTLEPLIIVDEFHTMFTDKATTALDGLNPSIILGLSATPKRGMNILSSVTGKQLKAEDMIKLDLHLVPPARKGDWRQMLASVKAKREYLERAARKLERNKGAYIRPIALIQVERTGKDQRGQGLVHSEDVRELLISSGVAPHEIAVKSATLDEIKQQKLLSKESEIRYIITKEALKEGWDCSFAYILGAIPNAHNNSSMTQLVGRILRQPYAKKTGIAALDESYVFFASGQTQEVLDNVKKGFEEEGLEDVLPNVAIPDSQGDVINPPQVVRIKQGIRGRYPESLMLPVWLVKEGKRSWRKFSYDIDIRPRLSWEVSTKISEWVKKIIPAISKHDERVVEAVIGLSGKMEFKQSDEAIATALFDELYLAQRFSETVGNAFVANEIAKDVVTSLKGKFTTEVLDFNAGYIAIEIEKELLLYRKGQERAIFEKLIKSRELELVVSDGDSVGFEMPEKDTVPNISQTAYALNLYDGIEPGSLNSLEQEAVRIIEDCYENVIWWARNKPQKNWYSIQGWQKNKIRPDFVVARKNDKDELEFVYVVETKGEQLIGNADTEYKKAVLDKMNEMSDSVEVARFKTTSVKMNDRFKFELIQQGQQETRIKTILKQGTLL